MQNHDPLALLKLAKRYSLGLECGRARPDKKMIDNPTSRWMPFLHAETEFPRPSAFRVAAWALFVSGLFAALPIFVATLGRTRFTLQFTLSAVSWLLALAANTRCLPRMAPRTLTPKPPGPGMDGMAVVLIAALLVPTGILFHHGISARARIEFRILVADFSGPSPARYPVADTLADHIEREILGQPGTRLIRLKEPIAEALDGASAPILLRRHHADLVIWGWYGPVADGMVVGMHVRHYRDERRIPGASKQLHEKLRPATCPLPGNFTLQSRWEHRCRDLALFICGLSHFLQQRPRRATTEWTAALRHSPRSRNGLITLFRGNAFFGLNRIQAAGIDSMDAVSRASQLPEAWNQHGIITAFMGESDKALRILHRAAQLTSTWPVPLCNQGIVLANMGDIAAAAERFESAGRRVRNDADTLYNQGIIAMTRKQWTQAATRFTQVIAGRSRSADAWYARGICHFKIGDLVAAHRDFTQTVRLRPTWSRALHDLGVVHARRGNLFMAVRSFSRALARHPGRTDTRRQRAAAFYLDREFSRAAADYTRILRTDPGDLQALTGRGQAIFRLGDLSGAAGDFSLLVKRLPAEPQPLVLRGMVALETENPETAEKDFSQALSLDPESVRAWTGRALARAMQQRLSESLADLKHALAGQPDSHQLWLLSGLIHRRMHAYDMATDHIRRATRLSPGQPEPVYQLALTFLMAGNRRQALSLFSQVLKMQPDHHEARHFRGIVLLVSGDMQAALRDFQKAVALVPEEAAYRLSLANALLISGQTDQAAREYLAGGQLVPNDPIPVFFAGQALEEAGKPQAALEIYRNALGKVDKSTLPLFQSLKRRIAELQRDLQRLNAGLPPSDEGGSQ